MDNVLDHVHDASRVLGEARRVLAPTGIFYMAVNIHEAWGGFLHRILSRLQIDRGHPHTFTLPTIRRFLEQNQFSILQDFHNDYLESRKQDRASASLKDRIKGFTGLSEFVYYAVCRRVAPPR
jgi:SAM-dependent methyltransferase